MTPEIRTALRSFAERVEHAYSDDFIGLVLFGSQARGDANGDSDIDVGVVLRIIGYPISEVYWLVAPIR